MADNKEKAKIQWLNLKIFFYRTIVKFNETWVKGIQHWTNNLKKDGFCRS